MYYPELISILAAISPACWVLWTSQCMLNVCPCSQCICILLSFLALVAHSIALVISFPLRYTFTAIPSLYLVPALVSLSHSLLFSVVCTLGVGISLTARHSLIIQRSAGIHRLLRGSPRLQWSTGCYLSIHPSLHFHSLCFFTCMNSQKPWGEPSKQCHIKERSCKSVGLKPRRLIGRSSNEGDRMRTRWGWFFIQRHNKQHTLLQHCRKGRGHRLTEELNMSRVEDTPTHILYLYGWQWAGKHARPSLTWTFMATKNRQELELMNL